LLFAAFAKYAKCIAHFANRAILLFTASIAGFSEQSESFAGASWGLEGAASTGGKPKIGKILENTLFYLYILYYSHD